MNNFQDLQLQERKEQILKHGFDSEHDKNTEANGDLLDAAIYLLLRNSKKASPELLNAVWPEKWDGEWREKFDKKDIEQSLVVAGALVWAEYDRLISEKKFG